MSKLDEAKDALDKLIARSRVDWYKPIQIAEILHRDRVNNDINLKDKESYRNKSKDWRDEITYELLGKRCTSSQKFQDNLFDENAIPPRILEILGKENRRTNGAVESYIYSKFNENRSQLSSALHYCQNSNKEDFDLKKFIDSFWKKPGLKRSIDKIYEIIVYSLFYVLVDSLCLTLELSVNEEKFPLLREFEDFSSKVLCLDSSNLKPVQSARVYRVGVTNAADRGLDMYANWGPAIQIKHLTLDKELAQNIVASVSSDKVIIVCKDAEKDVIVSLLSQIGWRNRIQSVVTELDLIDWYEKALRGKFSEVLGDRLLETLIEEIYKEFPSLNDSSSIVDKRNYQDIHDEYWITSL